MYGGEYNFPPGGLEDPRQVFADSLETLLVVGLKPLLFQG